MGWIRGSAPAQALPKSRFFSTRVENTETKETLKFGRSKRPSGKTPMAEWEEKMREEIGSRIRAMRINGNPDWFIRKALIDMGYPKRLVDEFGLEKNRTLSSISGDP